MVRPRVVGKAGGRAEFDHAVESHRGVYHVRILRIVEAADDEPVREPGVGYAEEAQAVAVSAARREDIVEAALVPVVPPVPLRPAGRSAEAAVDRVRREHRARLESARDSMMFSVFWVT